MTAGSLAACLEQLRERSAHPQEQGRLFEGLMLRYFRVDPLYKNRFISVQRYSDWARGQGADGHRKDLGIDLVAEERDGSLCGIQCKFYSGSTPVRTSDIDAFFSLCRGRNMRNTILVNTGRDIGGDALKKISLNGCQVINTASLERRPISWPALVERPEALAKRDPQVARPHQKEAISDVLWGFETSPRGRLIMACGTGKTLASLRIAESYVGRSGGAVLYLVPSISLLAQSMREWASNYVSRAQPRYFAVCHDRTVGREDGGSSMQDLEIPPTTSPDKVASALRHFRGARQSLMVFCTYQSLHVVHDAMRKVEGFKFDLVLCDEAHRTTGVESGSERPFTAINDPAYVPSERVLYMTATQKVYPAADGPHKIYSMNNPAVYGALFHSLTFSDAIDRGILSDYRVIVIGVSEQYAISQLGRGKEIDSKASDTSKIIGCWKALRDPGAAGGGDAEGGPLLRAIAFTNRIADSERFAGNFSRIVTMSDAAARCNVQHVSGAMSSSDRQNRLADLEHGTHDGTCQIVSNARCLGEGVDVPELDAVIFLNPKNSMVDVIQAVGRVMRKSDRKRFGHVILPIVVPDHARPDQELDSNSQYRVVWRVLKALRSHDDRLNRELAQMEIEHRLPKRIRFIGIDRRGKRRRPKGTDIPMGDIDIPHQELFAKLVEKVGDRQYWDDWAGDLARTAEVIKARIKEIIASDERARAEFDKFSKSIRAIINVNAAVSRDQIVDMLAQHVITKPIYDALFGNLAASGKNPASQIMERMLDRLGRGVYDELGELEDFYDSVRERIGGIDTFSGKQKILKDLYGAFFKKAFPDAAKRLGIVYTPIEIVDFILRSTGHVLRQEFGLGLSDSSVHVWDPFTGTGTFITRLLDPSLALIPRKVMRRKFQSELHANEITLLGHHIASMNIESTYLEQAGSHAAFPGLVFADTFQMYENQSLGGFVFPETSGQISRQKRSPIRVIVGNPPYDMDRKLHYPRLDAAIKRTYKAASAVRQDRSLDDAYIRAIRLCTDRLSGSGGMVAFVTNSGFLTKTAMSGLRSCLERDYSSIYCLNLRGNARTKGKVWAKEGDKIFGAGSMLPIAIVVLVKNPKKLAAGLPCKIYYRDVGDGLSIEKKFKVITTERHIKSTWDSIVPDGFHDWINKGDLGFYAHVPMDKEDATVTYPDPLVCSPEIGLYCFERSLAGHSTGGKDPKCYGPARPAPSQLPPNHKACEALYRPFEVRWLIHAKGSKFRDYYFEPGSNTPFRNPTICVSNRTDVFSVLMCDVVPDYHLLGQTRCFPMYRHDGRGWVSNISDGALVHFRGLYGGRVTKTQIFHYIYGMLHSPAYQSRYTNNLRRSLPRIPAVPSREDFDRLSGAGRRLAGLHCMRDVRPRRGAGLTARTAKATKSPRTGKGASPGRPGLSVDGMEVKDARRHGRVLEIRCTLRHGGRASQTALHVSGIPDASYDDDSVYSVDQWSPLKWFLKRSLPDLSFQSREQLRSYLDVLAAVESRSGEIILGLPEVRLPPFRPIPQDPGLPLTYSEHIKSSRLAKAR